MTERHTPRAGNTPVAGMHIDRASQVPPFEQVRERVIDLIESGVLAPGQKLPPVRSLAESLDLAANTVARSYKELEALGFVETRGRAGTVVASRLESPERHRRAIELTRDYLEAMEAIGLSRRETREHFERAVAPDGFPRS